MSPSEAVQGKGLRVVAIGGGTGLSALLRGLKTHVAVPGAEDAPIAELSAIVTVTDDGGSSGRLREELNVLPPGDIRNCMVAMAEDDALLSRLFQYRFSGGGALEGHNFGNLFLTALTAITGDFAEAVKQSSNILLSRGHIFPSTTSNVHLFARMEDGSQVKGETLITASKKRIVELKMAPANAKPLPRALEAVSRADLITIGPGSLFTSVISNLLVREMSQAIASSAAKRVYVCNLMTQANESLKLTAAEHIRAIYDHAHAPLFDVALVNSRPAPLEMLKEYAKEGAAQITVDREKIEALGVRCLEGDFLAIAPNGTARHDGEALARELLKIAAQASTSKATHPRQSSRVKMLG